MPTSSDRNLLVGIIAFQLDLVSKDDLVRALSRWSGQQHKPLEAIMLDAGFIDVATSSSLATLVEKKLSQQSTSTSLATLHDVAQLSAVIDELNDAEMEDSFKTLMSAAPFVTATDQQTCNPGSIAHDTTTQAPGRASLDHDTLGPEERAPASVRYQFLRPHARGGLGEVAVARDNELNREVALKQIQAHFADDAHARQRFLLEAEVTGGLEHPGVVPVYGLGSYGDGRPYYAMRFIRGQSLKQAADEFHRQFDKSGRGKGRGLAIRKLLDRFVSVCQTMEYAHSRGVLHRDLKPENIMLGPYGETLIVDWGLAKAAGQQIVELDLAEPTLRPSSGSGSAPTEMGSVIGTPAYMSPEQAIGRIDQFGPASDVYSLGATLYYLLCGMPPFGAVASPQTKPDVGRILEQVARGDFEKPREVVPSLPKPLAAICLKAMARTPSERYASPMAMGDDLQRFLADEPVTAYAEPWWTQSQRWLRQHQTLATTLVALIVASTIGSLAFSSMLSAKQKQLERTNQHLTVAQQQASQAAVAAEAGRQEAETQRALAEKQRLAAEQASQAATEAKANELAFSGFLVDHLLAAARPKGVHGGLGIDTTVVQALTAAEAEIESVFAGQPLAEARTRGGIGKTWYELGHYDRAVEQLSTAVQLLQQQHVQDEAEYLSIQADLATAYKYAGRLFEAIELQRRVLEICVRTFGESDRQIRTAQSNLGLSLTSAGELDEAIPLLQSVHEYDVRELGPDAIQTLVSADNLAEALRWGDASQRQRARELLEDVLPRRRRVLGNTHAHTLFSTNNLATFYAEEGELEKAIQMLQEAVAELKRQLGPTHPQTLVSQTNLAVGYGQLEQYDQAIELFRETIRESTTQLSERHPDTLNAMNLLADIYIEQGDVDAGIELYEKVLAIRSQVLGEYHTDTLQTRNNLALVYSENGQAARAIPLLERDLAYRRSVLPAHHPKLRLTINNLAAVYNDAQKPEPASLLYRELLDDWASQLEPIDSLRIHNNLADTYAASGKSDAAILTLNEAIEKHANTEVSTSPEYFYVVRSLGLLHQEKQDFPRARAALEQLVSLQRAQIERTSTASTPETPEKRAEQLAEQRVSLRGTLVDLANCQNAMQEFEQAERNIREAIEIAEELIPGDWRLTNARSVLGESLRGLGRAAEAETMLQEAHQQLREQLAGFPAYAVANFVGQSFDRLIRFYETQQRPDDAQVWREQREEFMESL